MVLLHVIILLLDVVLRTGKDKCPKENFQTANFIVYCRKKQYCHSHTLLDMIQSSSTVTKKRQSKFLPHDAISSSMLSGWSRDCIRFEKPMEISLQ